MLHSGEKDWIKVEWVAEDLLILKIGPKMKEMTEQYALVQYMQCQDTLDELESLLGRTCSRWSTHDGVDHTTKRPANKRPRTPLSAVKWYSIVNFKNIERKCYMVCYIPGNRILRKGLLRPKHRIYINNSFKHGL